jgi:hypothetical protein
VSALESLLEVFSANPYLLGALLELKPREAEETLISEILASDPAGKYYETLFAFHKEIIDELRTSGSYDELSEYLEYLADVWPCNPILNPLWRDNPDTSWELPCLGVQMLLQTPASGNSYWISEKPVLDSIYQRVARAECCPNTIMCGRDQIANAINTSRSLGLLLPTREQYFALANAQQRLFSETHVYLVRSESVVVPQTGLSLRSGKLKEQRIAWDKDIGNVDFFVVTEALPGSPSCRGSE